MASYSGLAKINRDGGMEGGSIERIGDALSELERESVERVLDKDMTRCYITVDSRIESR